MFGLTKKKSEKLDSRIRYQRSDFTKKLDRARHYKRTSGGRGAPEDEQDNFLSKFGLRTRLSRIIVLLVAIGLGYLIFIPNFLSPRTITVRGASGDEANIVRADIDSYISRSPFYNPQHNLVFLSAAKLRGVLLTDPIVYKVISIKRSLFRRTLTVSVELKSQRYVVKRGDVLYSVYNDGTIQSQLNVDNVSQWLSLYPDIVKIKDDSPAAELSTGEKYFSDSLLAQLNLLQERFKAVTTREIDYFEIPAVISEAASSLSDISEIDAPVNADMSTASSSSPVPPATAKLPLKPVDLYLYAKKQIPNYKGPAPDFRIIFNATKNDFDDVLAKLALLLAQTAPDRYNRLVYIDMRFENRGFICLTNTPCAASSAPVAPLPPLSPTPTLPPNPPTNTKGP